MRKWLIAAALTLHASLAHAQDTANADPASFTVLAETQLALPMTEITRLYSLRKGVTMLTAFEDSATQAEKLLEGEAGDVLITSYPAVINDLRQRGMADVYSLSIVTADKLVLAAQKNGQRDDRRELLAALETQPVLLANPDRYIEGLYGRDTLQYLFYERPVPVPPSTYNSRSAMYAAIADGNGIGLMLQSEARHVEGIDLTVPLAESSYPPIVYQALVIAGENMPLGRDFAEFLRSSEAQGIFLRYGFTQP